MEYCDQVDTGLKFDEGKLKFDFLFDIKTPQRTYFLAADTEAEMKAWVKSICNVCNLTATSDEDEGLFFYYTFICFRFVFLYLVK